MQDVNRQQAVTASQSSLWASVSFTQALKETHADRVSFATPRRCAPGPIPREKKEKKKKKKKTRAIVVR